VTEWPVEYKWSIKARKEVNIVNYFQVVNKTVLNVGKLVLYVLLRSKECADCITIEVH
jgi:hypothetical protein